MKAVVLEAFGGPEQLKTRTVPVPAPPAAGEVCIEVHAAGVNPFDAKLRMGLLQPHFRLQPNHILGVDVAGTIAACAPGETGFAIGDRVYGLLDAERGGAYAELVVSKASLVRRMPSNLTFAEAAAVPMAGCAAWVALVELGSVRAGTKLLVSGGGGGVGSFAVQLAKQRGAWVAATSSADKFDYVCSLGADAVFEMERAATQLEHSLDLVVDTVGGDLNAQCYRTLKPHGLMLIVSREDNVELRNRERLMQEFQVDTREVAFERRPDALDELTRLFEAGSLKPPELRIFALERASEAHRLIETGRTRGKLVLQVKT